MMQPFQEPSAFESVLRFFGRGGYGLRNLLKGNIEGAGRQVLDIFGDIVDAPLPGNWIPEASRKEDYTEASDLVGGMEPGIAKTAVDIVGGIALDPLTYIPGGAFVTAGKTAAKGARAGLAALPAGEALVGGLDKGLAGLRAATGNLRQTAATPIIQSGKAAEGVVRTGIQEYAVKELMDVSPDIGEKAYHLLNKAAKFGSDWQPIATRAHGKFGTAADQAAILDDLLKAAPWDDVTKGAVRDYLDKATTLAANAWQTGIRRNVFSKPGLFEKDGITHTTEELLELFKGSATTKSQAIDAAKAAGYKEVADPTKYAPLNYLPRNWEEIETGTKAFDSAKSGARIGHERTVLRPEEYIAKLKDNPIETNPSVIWGKYAEQEGRLARQAEIANGINKMIVPFAGKEALLDKAANLPGVVRGHIDDLMKRAEAPGLDYASKADLLDEAQAIRVAFFGLDPREKGVLGPFFNLLHKTNQWFKPAATSGAFIPRVAFNVRNFASSIPQTALTELPGATLASKAALVGDYATTVPLNALESFKDWFRHLGLGNFNESRFEIISKAAKAAQGNDETFLQLVGKADPLLERGIRNGVIDNGFVSTEQLISVASKAGDTKNWRTWKDAPAVITKGAEQRMRQALFEKALAGGMKEADAAAFVKRALFDYEHSSEANRALRDLIPFAQFTFKAVPQFAGAAARNPWLIPGVRGLYSQDSEETPMPQWLSNQPTIPLTQEGGKSTYLTSLGLPFEVAASLPNPSADLKKFGRQFEQGIVSQAHPGLKFLYSAAAGHDPYFGTEFFEYNKNPAIARALGAGEESAAARYYNMISGSGAAQPFTAPINLLNQAVNPDQTIPQRLLNLSGLGKVQTVDDQTALQSVIQKHLETDPNAKEFRTFYTRSSDPDMLAALEELKRVQKALREKRKAAQSPQQPFPH